MVGCDVFKYKKLLLKLDDSCHQLHTKTVGSLVDVTRDIIKYENEN